jgi:hypothetical protein
VPDADVNVRTRMVGAAQYASDAEKVAKTTAETGKAAETSGKQAKSGALGWLKWVAASAAVYKAWGYLKGAVSATVSLAKATSGLQRVTGLDARTASAWASTAHERGIQTASLQRAFTGMGRQIAAATSGSKPAIKAFRQMGLSMTEITRGNTEVRLERIATGLMKIRDPTQRAAAGQKLFGRAYQQMIPLLAKGGKGLAEQIAHMKRYGATLDQSGVNKGLAAAKSQRELNSSMDKLKLTIGLTLVPAVTQLAGGLTSVLHAGQPLFDLMSKYPAVTYLVAGALAALILGLKLYTAYQNESVIVTKLAAAAQWLWNASVMGFPLLLIVGALIAIGVGLVVLYKKVGWFRAAVNAAWAGIKAAAVAAFDFIRDHWKVIIIALAGPLGAAVVLIVNNFGKIKAAAHALWQGVSAVANGIKWAFQQAWAMLGPIASKIGSAASAAGSAAGKIASVAGHIPGLQWGGVHMRSGPALVGERGPEIVSLPAGSHVAPVAPGGGGLVVHSQLVVDGRVLAEAVGRAVAERKARR